jgi:UTP pyrophosphatase
MAALPLLGGYPEELRAEAEALIAGGKALELIARRYPERHRVRSNQQLFAYVQELKARHLKSTPQLSKILFDKRLRSANHALGLHTTRQRVHGTRLRTNRELRVAGLFRDAPAAFLRMIVVHELAHQKHAEHDRAFYRLCCHLEPDYHQLEFDLRLYLSALETREQDLTPLD